MEKSGNERRGKDTSINCVEGSRGHLAAMNVKQREPPSDYLGEVVPWSAPQCPRLKFMMHGGMPLGRE